MAIAARCFLVLFSVGCQGTGKKVTTPTARLQTETGTVLETKGDAKTPANLKEDSTRTELKLPAGSEIARRAAALDQPETVSIKLAADSVLSSVTARRDFQAPVAFDPPAPPSPLELAKGKAVLGAYGLAGLLALAGVGMLYLGHGKAGGCLLLGAFLVPVCVQFLTSTTGLLVGGGFLCIGLTLYSAWHLMQRKLAAAGHTAIERNDAGFVRNSDS